MNRSDSPRAAARRPPLIAVAAAPLAVAAGVAAILAAGLAACAAGGAPAKPAEPVIARFGQRAVTARDFTSFLEATLGGPEEAAAAGPELKSRLLDQFLDDALLAGAAEEAGLGVSDDEIKDLDPNGSADPAAVRRILLTRKFKQKVILDGVKVSEPEVRTFFEQHLNEYRQPARVVLRQMLLDSEAEAKRIRQQLMADPATFEEIAETRSLAPDGGKPYPLEEALLPETLRKAVDGLKPGDLSPVVKDPQGFFILKLEDRQPEKEASFDEARGRIELKLLQELSQKRYAEYMDALRRKTSLTIDEASLGFPYVKKGQP